MAVMKVCCGCMSTRSGTLTVLLLYGALYIAGIVFLGISIENRHVETWYNESAINEYNCKGTDSIKDSWWCTAMFDLQYDIRTWEIVAVIILALFLLFDLVALFGTSRGTYWPLLPWIILEFVRLAAKLIALVMIIIVWAVYMGENEDSSYVVATGVIGSAAAALFFYLWLCVVSYFQVLREIEEIGNIHKLDGSPTHKVTPFIASDTGSFDRENPYDNLSEHTTKESLDDTTSIKSGIKAPSITEKGSNLDVKTTALEANE